jgi:membrane protein
MAIKVGPQPDRNVVNGTWPLIKKTFQRYNEVDPFRQAAVVAYYAIFSLPGLMIILVKVAGSLFGEEAVTGELSSSIASAIGPSAAKEVEAMIANASTSGDSAWATVVAIATIVFGATGVFYQLKISLNRIWGVKAEPEKAWLKLIKDRFFSLGVVLSIAFLLVISLVVSSGITALNDSINLGFSEAQILLARLISTGASIIINTLLFAMIFKILPDVEIQWRDTWIGAFATAILFEVGKYLIGLYLGQSNPGNAYGTAGSVVLILTWISYTCLLLFLGAVFTQVYSERHGHKLQPSPHAKRINEDEFII